MKLEFGEAIDGPRLMVGLGFTSQAGLVSAAVSSTAISSGEHEISLMSPLGTVTRGRVWANAVLDQIARVKNATKARGNSFLNSIDRELPFPLLGLFTFWYF